MPQALAPVFLATDRCDRCGAPARLRAILRTGVILLCGHHAREHHAKLVEAGAFIEADNSPCGLSSGCSA